MKRTVPRKSASDICIVGGAGHVGLPFAIMFAHKGRRVHLYDLNQKALDIVQQGKLPFMEFGAEPLLKEALARGLLTMSSDPRSVGKTRTVVITVGTPVDEFLNPNQQVIRRCIDDLLPHLTPGQLVVLRSTVYPGTTDWLDHYCRSRGKKINISFCPERIVQGNGIREMFGFPQIISGTTPEAGRAAARLFKSVGAEVVNLTPLEAEFAKLFSNAYRYIQFAIANQFYMIANSAGVDYAKVLAGMKKNYQRAGDIPRAGFTAGPCLFKDTMQLAAFANNQFSLGHSAMMINEGLVLYLVERMQARFDLSDKTIGLLGMAFKADIDDPRASLSYKLKKALAFQAKRVLTTDPHVTTDPELVPLDKVLAESDVLVLCVPHSAYQGLCADDKPMVDIWGFLSQDTRV
jgi:UDP-N-acetyl-D-mannosaminuronic acid dehydrogenase